MLLYTTSGTQLSTSTYLTYLPTYYPSIVPQDRSRSRRGTAMNSRV